ncbi:hypothetical protein CANTEDRAFT_133563 [Yamadazyma tenuis ATCC 10573]|nr:uncharacterized protein CANTEDRAFT_133563 [Yamadazyma tenuis ATCC 10573]EGV65258.1 hypothetical protein CANTEDRAFT_133563 [Yamadazyma tenuis ATCC 10573]
MKLWSYYFEVLEINIDDIDRITASYYKMIELKYATPLMIFQFAKFLQDEGRVKESYKIYEIGLKEFNDSRIRFEIYNNYLVQSIKFNEDKERIRDLFDKCLIELPNELVKPIIVLYSEFEYDNGLIIKAFNIVNDFIMSTSLDPIDLILLLSSKYHNNVDLRQWFEKWLTLKLTKESLMKLLKEFIKFEIANKQYDRVRTLYEYSHSNINYTFKDWEDFELEYGNESTFKKMLRFKTKLKETAADPVGFVMGSSTTSKPSNPDIIDIDM